jgi:two-component system, OmpR family, phosphate regulon response regulator PhoB
MAKLILLVEDDLDIQKIYSEKLKTKGFDVTLAIDAAHALHELNEHKPSLILLDIMLPGDMNGFEVLEKIKVDPATANIPVIVLTNLDTEKDAALKAGANDYLLKANTTLEELVNKVTSILH